MITREDIQRHAIEFPTFKADRLVEWLDEKPGRWRYFRTVELANRSRRKDERLTRLAQREN